MWNNANNFALDKKEKTELQGLAKDAGLLKLIKMILESCFNYSWRALRVRQVNSGKRKMWQRWWQVLQKKMMWVKNGEGEEDIEENWLESLNVFVKMSGECWLSCAVMCHITPSETLFLLLLLLQSVLCFWKTKCFLFFQNCLIFCGKVLVITSLFLIICQWDHYSQITRTSCLQSMERS